MKSASFYAAYLVKKLWTLAAVLLVFVAVSISVLRYSLPYLDKQKGQVEGWLSNQYGVELAIGELSAGWSGIGPTLILRDVHLKQSEQSPIGLNIKETQIELDFWGSILARQIQSTRFDLEGLILSIDLAQIQSAESEFPIVEALESLFLEQLQRFSVQDSQIKLATQYDEQLIQIEHVSWINRLNRHQGVGQLRVVELASNSAYFVLDLYGDKNDLSGHFFAKGEELDLSPWLNQVINTQYQLTESRGNFTFWATINESKVTHSQVDFDESQFTWETPESTIKASVVGGDLFAEPDDNGWRFAIDNLTIQAQEQNIISSWQGHVSKEGNLRLKNARTMEIGALLPILPLIVDPALSDLANQLSPQARIDDFALQFDQHAAMQVSFSRMEWQQVDNLPGLSDLAGSFNWFENSGLLSIQGVAGELQIDNILQDNIAYQNFQFDAYLESNATGVDIIVPELRFDSETVSFTQSIAYNTADDYLSISSKIDPLSVAKVRTLLPTELMGVETRQYLLDALIDGEVNDARLLWNGSLQSFPYGNNDGVFQASVDLQEVTFNFDQHWPELTDFSASLLFENEGLTIKSQQGSLMGVSLQNLTAVIPKLATGAVLDIDTVGVATGPQVTELMMNSNLANSVGSALNDGVNVQGQLLAKLNLHIPLTGENVVATGAVELDQNDILIPSLAMTFAKAKGVVNFVNDVVSFDSIEAELLQQPVELSFAGQSGEKGAYNSDIQIQGDWLAAPLTEHYHSQLGEFLTGGSQWKATVNLALLEDDYQYELNLSSDLQGVSSTLPLPFAKQEMEDLPLLVTSQGNKQASTVAVKLGDKVTFDGILPHKELLFSRAHLAIGNSDTVGLGLGFSVSANLPQAEFNAWYSAISSLLAGMPSSERPILSAPDRVYLESESLQIAGQSIEKLNVVAKRVDKDWLLNVNADQARAKVTFNHDWDNKGIEVDADFINLAKWNEPSQDQYQDTDLANLPPISFNCKQCAVNGIDLGKIEFAMSRTDSGMHIDTLAVDQGNGTLTAQGDWFISDEGHSTRLEGNLSSGDFGALLKGVGFDSGIKDSKANFDFDLSWQQAPHEFNFESLNGDVAWRLSDGYLSELPDKGARIFSLLSLQSLVRKLSLDFRDVFAKGFFYDKMTGDVLITDGKAITDNTVIDGGAGEMTIAGFTDLTNQQLNYQVGFTPNVTSSLPLLVYWMVNPATAIAALAIDQVLTEAKVISHVRYSVTGTISEPVTTLMDRKSKDIVLPARTTEGDPVESGKQPDIPPPQTVIEDRVSIEVVDG